MATYMVLFSEFSEFLFRELLKYVESSRQFQLLVYACRGWWEVRYHIADYAEKFQ